MLGCLDPKKCVLPVLTPLYVRVYKGFFYCLWNVGPFIFMFMAYSPLYFFCLCRPVRFMWGCIRVFFYCLWNVGPFIFMFMAYSPLYFRRPKKHTFCKSLWVFTLKLKKLHIDSAIKMFERQDQYFQKVWFDNNLLMLGLIFEYVNLYLWCQILTKFDGNQIWLTTWLFVYIPESDHKSNPSEKKNVLWADLSA